MTTSYSFSQDAFFSQFNNYNSYNNPSATYNLSHFDDFKSQATINYREQWRSLNATFRTIQAEAEYNLYSSTIDKWSVGMTLLNDVSNNALVKNNLVGIKATYLRKFILSKQRYHLFSLGSQLNYYSSNINSSDLWFGRQYDKAALSINPDASNGETLLNGSGNFISLSLGATWKFNFANDTHVKTALAYHHLNSPQGGYINEQYLISKRLFFQSELQLKINRSLSHKVFLTLINQSPSFQLLPGYGMNLNLSGYDEVSILATISCRVSNTVNSSNLESIILGFGLDSKKWIGQISFDYNVSSLSSETRGNGAFELSLSYLLFD